MTTSIVEHANNLYPYFIFFMPALTGDFAICLLNIRFHCWIVFLAVTQWRDHVCRIVVASQCSRDRGGSTYRQRENAYRGADDLRSDWNLLKNRGQRYYSRNAAAERTPSSRKHGITISLEFLEVDFIFARLFSLLNLPISARTLGLKQTTVEEKGGKSLNDMETNVSIRGCVNGKTIRAAASLLADRYILRFILFPFLGGNWENEMRKREKPVHVRCCMFARR